MYEWVHLWVWLSVYGLSEYISLMSLDANQQSCFCWQTQLSWTWNLPKPRQWGQNIWQCWHFLLNLSKLTVKGLSSLKVQLVMVIKIDQHVLYWFVCKAYDIFVEAQWQIPSSYRTFQDLLNVSLQHRKLQWKKKKEQQHVRQFDPSKPDLASFITVIPPNTLKQCSMCSICIVLLFSQWPWSEYFLMW